MKAVGLICEYNPFHNGHLYHIQKTKELFPEDTIVLIMTGNVTQRGELSILTKWEKTEIALFYGIDLVVELPFLFATQSADTFCFGALKLLSYLQVSHIVFGSEIGLIEPFVECANTQLYSKEYQKKVKNHLENGFNYPTSLSLSLEEMTGISITKPNDLLGLGYVKEIIKNQYPITPITIPRTNDYHSSSFTGTISSATSIRMHLKKKENIGDTVPWKVKEYLENPIFLDSFFPYLKYKILSEEHLEKYETVDEKIANRMKDKILESDSLEEFINNIKTKYYTYNRLMRMCSHLLFSFTKEENQQYQNDFYLRILGFSNRGQQYLKEIKDKMDIPIITNYSNDKDNHLVLETRVVQILSLIKGNEFLKEEISHIPIMQKGVT